MCVSAWVDVISYYGRNTRGLRQINIAGMSFDYIDSLDTSHKEIYERKLRAAGLESCPFQIQEDSWLNDPKGWPPVEYGDIYSYLIDFPKLYSREKMKNYKSLDAHMYFKDGWVETLYHFPCTNNNVVFKCKVKPSQRVTEEPHQPWVSISKDGTVLAGHCTCMAGLGETCSHVAAMLFKMEAAVRLGYTTSSCTSEACKWNSTFVKSVKAAAISDITFYKENYGSKSASKKRKRTNTPSNDEIKDFLSELEKASPKSILLSAYEPYHKQFIDDTPSTDSDAYPLDMRMLFVENASEQDIKENSKIAMRKIYDITDTQLKNVRKLTIGQSSCPQWYRYRAGRVTSSTAHNLLVTNKDRPSHSSILKITTVGNNAYLGPAVQHGKENEAKAIDAVLAQMKERHSDVTIWNTGLEISPKTPFISASPDFILECACCGKWVGEVKCPFSHKDDNIANINDSNFALENDNLKKNHPHYTQVQMHMYCTGINKCLYAIWTLKDIKIVAVKEDKCFISAAVENLSEKYEHLVLPEIISRDLELKKQKEAICKIDKENCNKLFCFCNGPETGKMIGCDNPSCKTGNQWFHFTCLKMKRPPKGRWLCPICKKSDVNGR